MFIMINYLKFCNIIKLLFLAEHFKAVHSTSKIEKELQFYPHPSFTKEKEEYRLSVKLCKFLFLQMHPIKTLF
jgi:hypothetical protein